MASLLDELDVLLTPAPDDTRAIYDRVASAYDRFRSLWLKLAGGTVEAMMLGDLKEILAPGQRILDAGCGTGTLSRSIRAIQPAIALTMLDLSPAMLTRTADIPGTHVEGSVLDLPFPDESFDIVVSGWVIETVPDPIKAVSEYLRIIATTGYVLYTFSSLPQGWVSRAGTALLRAVVENRFAGHFLPPEETPWHTCERSRWVRSHSGLASYIVLRKCCTVGPGIVPAAMADVPPTEFAVDAH
jgi:ubiquinone/menaquinone biosynthesis C-methylase UbiE